jgi:hypothetical protein
MAYTEDMTTAQRRKDTNMAQQAIVIYISQEGGEINDLTNLVSELITELDWVGTLNGEDIPIKIRLSDVPSDEERYEDIVTSAACKHCQRQIGQDSEGRWVDPEATGDDSVWRETCDAHDTFTAEHEPEAPSETICERHGGTWGEDETCERCTYDNGMARPLTDKGPLGPGALPTATCGCGYDLIWIDGHWEHDAAPSLWGDDHEPDAPAPAEH